MPRFSINSKNKLKSCREELQILFNSIILDFDCTIIEGHRSIERQIRLFDLGKSKLKLGKHNKNPSEGIDVGPYISGRGIPWPDKKNKTYIKDLALFYYFSGWVMSRAKNLNILIRWGGDWDRDFDLTDQTFDDLVHFELIS